MIEIPLIDPPKLICEVAVEEEVELLISSSFNSELSELSKFNCSTYRGGSFRNKKSGKTESKTKIDEIIKPIHHCPTHLESPSDTGGSSVKGSTQWESTFPPKNIINTGK